MSQRHFFVLLLILLATPVSILAQQAAAKEVKRLERTWLDAYEKFDHKAMDLIVADDFSITFPDGTVQTKAQVLASLKPAAGGPATSSKFIRKAFKPAFMETR